MRALMLAGVLSICAVQARGQQCEGDFNGDGHVSINELVLAVTRALDGCPTPPTAATLTEPPQPTATLTPASVSATPTVSATPQASMTPVVDHCPFTFDDLDAVGCRFVGLYDAQQDRCRDAMVGVTVARTPAVTFTLETDPVVTYVGESVDAHTFKLRQWYTADGLSSRLFFSSAHLTDDGRMLTMGPFDVDLFSIAGCDFQQFTGFYSSR